MKNMIKLPAILLGLMLLLTGISQKVMAQDEDVSLQTFYDELSPYGTWIQDSDYGYVWRPDVDQNEFRPYYTNGHWVMTEYGNTWVSDYEWGWAPFHYGRWVTDRYNQWLWIPDTIWGPAWVNWRSGDDYYGWAPLGPSISVNVGFSIPSFWWVFIPQRNIYFNRFPRYNWNHNRRYLGRTTIINNVYVHNRNTYYTGPGRDEIRRVTNRDVRVYNINRSDRPGRSRIQNNTVNIYQPRPNRGQDNHNAAPKKVEQRGDIVRTNAGNRGSANNRTGENNRMERPQKSGETRVGAVRERSENKGTPRTEADRSKRNADARTNVRTPGQRTAADPQRAAQIQEQRQQQAQQRSQQGQQREQRDQQAQQRAQQQTQQREQQSQQETQQREQQRQQQAQQRAQQQTQQREQQSQQQAQQREQQRQQQAQQRAQQQTQQRQQRQEAPKATPHVERVTAPQRTAAPSTSGSSGASRSAGRSSRGGGRG